MKKPLLYLLLSLFAASMYGCSGVGYYVEPQDKNIAKLRIKIQEPVAYNMNIAMADTKTCKPTASLGLLSGARENDANRIGILDTVPPQEGIMERRVTPGTPLAIVPLMSWAKLNAAQIFSGAVARVPTVTPGSASPAQKTVNSNDDYQRRAKENASIAALSPGVCLSPEFTPEAGKEYEVLFTQTPGSCKVSVSELYKDTSGLVARKNITPELKKNIHMENKGLGVNWVCSTN
jgi:hypothetical protein